MRERNWGRIINIASTHGLVASAEKSAYVVADRYGDAVLDLAVGDARGHASLVKGFGLEPVSEEIESFLMICVHPSFFVETLPHYIASSNASDVLNVVGCYIEVAIAAATAARAFVS